MKRSSENSFGALRTVTPIARGGGTVGRRLWSRARLLGVIVFGVSIVRTRTPSNKSWPEAGKGQDSREASPVRTDFIKPECSVVGKPEHDPPPIRRIGSHVRVYVATFVFREKAKIGTVGSNGYDVCRNSRNRVVSIDAKDRCLPSGDQSCLTATSKLNGVIWKMLLPSRFAVKSAAPVGSPLKPT
jgi:hypothetical protein